jgi:hypothetical protein
MHHIGKLRVRLMAIAGLAAVEAVLLAIAGYATPPAKSPGLSDGANSEQGPFVPNDPDPFKRVFRCGQFNITLAKIPNTKTYQFRSKTLTLSTEEAGFEAGGTVYIFRNGNDTYFLRDGKNGAGNLEVLRSQKGAETQTILREQCQVSNPLASAQPGNQVPVAPFDINVTLTPAAQRKLQTSKESIIVMASIYGQPKKNSPIKVNEIGSVDLVNAQIQLPGAGRARFNQLAIDASKRDQLVSQDYQVNVNVFSGRQSSPDNILTCDFFDGKISKIQPGITVKCGLIEEYTGRLIESSNESPVTRSRSTNSVPALW